MKMMKMTVVFSPQLGGRAPRVHEQQESASVLPGETEQPEALVAVGDVPAEAGAEDPQVPPPPAGTGGGGSSSLLP